jgi:hypothetical protein
MKKIEWNEHNNGKKNALKHIERWNLFFYNNALKVKIAFRYRILN